MGGWCSFYLVREWLLGFQRWKLGLPATLGSSEQQMGDSTLLPPFLNICTLESWSTDVVNQLFHHSSFQLACLVSEPCSGYLGWV
jgi:hypothetical protein